MCSSSSGQPHFFWLAISAILSLTLICRSCGFDACEHEYPSMSRHNRRVPVSFYLRFAKDTREFADKYAKGKLISVLEGGYSDRALISGGMAHLTGLIDIHAFGPTIGGGVHPDWWSVENLATVRLLQQLFAAINNCVISSKRPRRRNGAVQRFRWGVKARNGSSAPSRSSRRSTRLSLRPHLEHLRYRHRAL